MCCCMIVSTNFAQNLYPLLEHPRQTCPGRGLNPWHPAPEASTLAKSYCNSLFYCYSEPLQCERQERQKNKTSFKELKILDFKKAGHFRESLTHVAAWLSLPILPRSWAAGNLPSSHPEEKQKASGRDFFTLFLDSNSSWQLWKDIKKYQNLLIHKYSEKRNTTHGVRKKLVWINLFWTIIIIDLLYCIIYQK